jgi:RNA polymerase sigma-B factor
VHDLAMRLRSVRERLNSEHGRQPTVAELAAASGAAEEAVVEALGALTANDVVSLQTPSDDDGERTLGDELGDSDSEYRRIEHRSLLEDLFRCLSAHERRVLNLRFDEDLTQRQIGDALGVSQMSISRLLKTALPRLTELAERQATVPRPVRERPSAAA